MIEKLIAEKFRNLNFISTVFHPRINFIIGDNGSGKTSILEAIFFIAHGKSFRTSNSDNLIQSQESFFSLSIKSHAGNQLGVRKGIGSSNSFNEFRINREKCSKLSVFAKNLAVQVITPESFQLFFGGPKQRRKFLDLGLFHVKHEFSDCWKSFSRILKQRNACLKNKTDKSTIGYWDNQFVEASYRLSQYREQYISDLSKELQFWLKILLPELYNNINISYYPGWNIDTNLLDVLSKNLTRELQLGYSTTGAHKFDLRFMYDGKNIELKFSRGQQKMFLFALTFAQTRLINNYKNEVAVVLIDDVGAELDTNSQKLLKSALDELGCQVIITAINEQPMQQLLPTTNKYSMFHVKHGKLSKMSE